MKKILFTALCIIVFMVLGNNIAQANANENVDNALATDDMSSEIGSNTTVTPTPKPTITPTVTPIPKVTDGDYTKTTLTVKDVKGWNWEKGGKIQIGKGYYYFGQTKSTKVIWVEGIWITDFKEKNNPDIVITEKQWTSLKKFTYNGIKYKTQLYSNEGCLKRLSKTNISAKDKYRGFAHIGDTWISKSGKKTKLTGITWNKTEIPAYGTGIDLYTGLLYGDSTLKNGNTGGTWNGDSTYMGQKLIVVKDPVNKKTFSYFRDQWLGIEQYEDTLTLKVKAPKDGQIVGYFTQYDKALDMWVWIGPDF